MIHIKPDRGHTGTTIRIRYFNTIDDGFTHLIIAIERVLYFCCGYVFPFPTECISQPINELGMFETNIAFSKLGMSYSAYERGKLTLKRVVRNNETLWEWAKKVRTRLYGRV